MTSSDNPQFVSDRLQSRLGGVERGTAAGEFGDALFDDLLARVAGNSEQPDDKRQCQTESDDRQQDDAERDEDNQVTIGKAGAVRHQ